MRHFASPRFWESLEALPPEVQALARKNFDLLKADSRHPSLHLKRIKSTRYWSVRVGLKHRALAVEIPGGLQWFWIGTHAEYDELVS